MPWVLADMMRRAAAWLADKHTADAERAPDAWKFKTADEVQTQDPVLAWLDAGEVAPDPAGTRSSLLRANFVSWCKDQGKAYPTETKWGRRLNELGFPVTGRDSGGRYRPLRIIPPGLADFMLGQPGTPTQHQTQHPENPQVSGSSVYGVYGLYSQNNITQEESLNKSYPQADHTHSYAINGGATQHTTQGGFRNPSDLGNEGSVHGLETLQNPLPDPATVHDPVAGEKTLPPETGENGETRKKSDSPPKPKKPRARLTDEERAERLEARKAKLAQERLDARAAKVAELGGPLVQLPAVVLRDQTILPCDAATAAQFLGQALDEISVDVEHSGFPAQHRDYVLRTVQLGNEGCSVVFDPSGTDQAEVIRYVLAHAKTLHAHSALADLIPLERAGLGDKTMWDRMYDTVLAAKLSDPSMCDSDEAGLKALAKALLGPDYALSWKCDEARKELFTAGGWLEQVEVTTAAEKSGWAQVPLCETFIRYAGSDVMDCSAIARVLGIS